MSSDKRTAIYRFCNYQERSHQEVKDRLYELGSYPDEVAQLITELIEADLLNEESFAKAFARGKFYLKHWGRIKILQHLKQHRISEYLLKKAIKEIDPNDYFEKAIKLGTRKWESLKTEKDSFAKRGKIFRYLQEKGYESSVITEVIQNITATE